MLLTVLNPTDEKVEFGLSVERKALGAVEGRLEQLLGSADGAYGLDGGEVEVYVLTPSGGAG